MRDGINRPTGDNLHCWQCSENDWIAYLLNKQYTVNRITLILDSGLDKLIAMSHLQKDDQLKGMPKTMPKNFRIEGKIENRWHILCHIKNNHQRLFRLNVNKKLSGIRFILEKTYGSKKSRVYAFYFE